MKTLSSISLCLLLVPIMIGCVSSITPYGKAYSPPVDRFRPTAIEEDVQQSFGYNYNPIVPVYHTSDMNRPYGTIDYTGVIRQKKGTVQVSVGLGAGEYEFGYYNLKGLSRTVNYFEISVCSNFSFNMIELGNGWRLQPLGIGSGFDLGIGGYAFRVRKLMRDTSVIDMRFTQIFSLSLKSEVSKSWGPDIRTHLRLGVATWTLPWEQQTDNIVGGSSYFFITPAIDLYGVGFYTTMPFNLNTRSFTPPSWGMYYCF